MSLIRIATRNSPLALWQANYVKDQLLAVHADSEVDLSVEIVGMTTKGDQLLDRSLSKVGGKGLFLKELEVSLLNNETDIAVHSMKDVPVDMPQGLEIPVVCEREDARDALVSNHYQNLYALPSGARVGTSSLRRIAQLKHAFPALNFIELRGNVNTRLAKLDAGDYDAIILAAAGLIRLGFTDRIKQFITPELCLPAVGQGIVGIQCRSDDAAVKALLQPLHNRESELCLQAERAMNAQLDGGCQVPVAGYAELIKGKMRMRGLVGEVDGSAILSNELTSPDISLERVQELGQDIAKQLLAQGAGDILSALYKDPVELPKPSKAIVLLTRQHRYLGNTATLLERLDYKAVHIPTLAVQPNYNAVALEQFKKIHDYTDLVFVSRNSVEIGMQMIEQQGGVPDSVRVLTVGAETAKQLYRHGVDAMFPQQGCGAEALLKVKQLSDLSDRKILIVCGDNSLDWPEEVMRERGAEVERAIVYYQSVPEKSAKRLNDWLDNDDRVDGVFAHSSQSVINLISMLGQHAHKVLSATLVAGSERIAATATEYGWQGEVRIAESPSNKHMMIEFSGRH